MKTHNHYFKTNIDFVHHNLIDNENFSINFKDYPLGSMPREANSFLISRLIQADIFPSPSCSTANSIALRNSGSNLNWNGGLPLREVFLSLCIDTLFSPVYIVYVSIHNTHTFTNKQAPEVLPARTEALITHLLKRSKSMTNYNSTLYTAIGASKIGSLNEIHLLSNKDENISRTHKLLNSIVLGYYAHAVAKSTAEPGNSNNLYTANKSTPFNRTIFVCSTRTPKETTQLKIQPSEFLSMVACNGKGSPFAVFRVSQFSSPLHATAQTLESLAVAPEKPNTELSAMIYKFLTLTGNKRLKITVQANSKAEALSRIQFTNKPLLVARLRTAIAKNPQNMTACDTEQNNRLLSLAGCGYDEVTTTYDGSRSRYTSGLFLPQIYQSHGLTTPESHSKFAVRVTLRNKANAIRTNKEGYSYVAVEPLSHPFSDKPLSLTKAYDTMKNPNTLYTANTGTQAPIALSSRFEGVAYA